jgi:hypothetical protein
MSAWVEGGGRVSARPPTHFLLLRQMKVSKEKATHSLRPLRVATGQTCVGALAGCAVELALRCARRSNNHGESVNEACALRRACSPRNQPVAGAARWAWTAQTSKQPHGPLLRSTLSRGRKRRALGIGPSEAMARRDVRLRVPFRMRRGAQRSADKGSRLSERSEFERDPAGREHRRLPEAKRRDAACRVAFSLVTFFWRSKRKLLAGRATPGLRPVKKHANNYQNNSN